MAEELAALLARDRGEARLQQALACYFAAGEGWRDAEAVLGGAFAISGAAAKAPGAEETE